MTSRNPFACPSTPVVRVDGSISDEMKTVRLLSSTPQLNAKCNNWIPSVKPVKQACPQRELGRAVPVSATVAGVPAAVVASDGVVGGGGAPGLVLPGWAVALPTTFAERLRTGDPCVVGRVEDDRCLLDLRCVPAERDIDVAKAVLAL